MNPARIRTTSLAMQSLCIITMIIIPLGFLWAHLDFERYAETFLSEKGMSFYWENITSLTIALSVIVSVLPTLVMLYGVYRLFKLFGLFKQGCYITREGIGHLHWFSLMLFVSTLLTPIVTTSLSVLLTWNNPPGQRSLALFFGSTQLIYLLVAGTFLVVTWILGEALELAEENAEFI